MNSQSSLQDRQPPERFPRFQPARGTLGSWARELLIEQKNAWEALRAGYASLGSVKTREIPCDGYVVFLQFNPGRIVSTGAPVDPESIRKRKCFLCKENLPQQQRGILYEDEFLLLCNPVPIFSHHYTIAHLEHKQQEIEPAFSRFLQLAKELSPDFTVFYNGPKCGASAPDHLHFQASPRGAIPIEQEAATESRRKRQESLEGVELLTLNNLDREVFVLEGKHPKSLEKVFFGLTGAMRKILGLNEEPLMNVLCSFDGGAWRVILFPRSKHRPDAYFSRSEDRILVSPAAVDIGGLVITPLEKDFQALDATALVKIFREVSVSSGFIGQTLKAFGL